MNAFPVTSATLIQKIKSLPPGADDAAWVRFWDTYAGAIRQFAARKGGDENADDIVMSVFGKLVDVLRSGQYIPEKGAFHSYLSTMILNEVHMQHRKDMVRKVDMRISLDRAMKGDEGSEDDRALLDAVSVESLDPDSLKQDASPSDSLDEDWRQAILAEAVEHVLTKTALSERDRGIYREYALQERPIDEVAAKYGISRNYVSQIKTRISKRIIAFGKELVARFGEI